MKLEEAIKQIREIDTDAVKKSEEKWLTLVKPLFSLGRMENVITQIAGIKGSCDFTLENKVLVIMCADNGVVEEGISQCGNEVTAIAAKSFLRCESAACIMAKRAGVKVLPIDAGMVSDIENMKRIKLAYGSGNIAKGPAMSRDECTKILESSIETVGVLAKEGQDIILTGEMGIGNTTTASAVTSVLLGKDPSEVTGRGAGLSGETLKHKIEVIKKAISVNSPDRNDPIDVLSKVGGYDIIGMTGLFIGGAVYGIPVVIDGFISSIAAVAACRIESRVKNFIIPSHLSDEPAAAYILNELGFKPFITSGMFLGEGSGAVSLMPLLDMALDVYKGLNTFDKWEHEAYKVLR